jgi:hypothetical protein
MILNVWESNEQTGIAARITYNAYADSFTAEVTAPFWSDTYRKSFTVKAGGKSRVIKCCRDHLRRQDW